MFIIYTAKIQQLNKMCKKIDEYLSLKYKNIIIYLHDQKIISIFAISEITIYPHFNNQSKNKN